MVYTVTLNPALDYTLHLKTLELGAIQKSVRESMMAGGKGINVSTMLTRLGVENTALGFLAGFTGEEIARHVEDLGISSDFIRLSTGSSRINVKIRSGNDQIEETDINATGADVDPDSLEKFYAKLDQIQNDDYFVLAGSIPDSLPEDIYGKILSRLSKRKTNCIVDATGILLRNTLKYKPFLIKPNVEELGELFHVMPETPEHMIRFASRLQKEGARNVLVSMGEKGAILLTESGQVLQADARKGKVVNTVGAGDSMVAGFLAGWLASGDYKRALELGIAAGSATAFREGIGAEPVGIYEDLLIDSNEIYF